MNNSDSIADKLASYKSRLSTVGLDDNDVTNVLVSVLGDVTLALDASTKQLQQAKRALWVASGGLILMGIGLSVAITGTFHANKNADGEAGRQLAALMTRMEAASHQTEQSADLNNASAQVFIKSLEDIRKTADTLSGNVRTTDESSKRLATAVDRILAADKKP